MKQYDFSLVSDAQLGNRQCLDEVTVVAIGASVTRLRCSWLVEIVYAVRQRC